MTTTMSYETLLYKADDRVALITLNRPERMNAFTWEMLDAWAAALTECRTNEAVSVVIWVGLIALAVGDKHPDWAVWLAMATGIGILCGVFFGAWAGFVTQTHALEELDRHPETSGPLPGQAAEGPVGAPITAEPIPDRQQLRAQDLTHVVATWPGWLLELPDRAEMVPISHVIRVPVLHDATRWIVHTAEHPSRRIEYQDPDAQVTLVRAP